MHPKYLFLFFVSVFLIGFKNAAGQNIEEDTVNVNNETCNYFSTRPKSELVGILLLLPARGERPKEVFKNTSIPSVLAAKGYLTVIPNLRYSLFAGKKIKAQITSILAAQTIKYNLNKPNLLIGGFSAGGSVALSYSEFLLSSDSLSNLKGIFVIDSPIDLERLYNSSERMLKYNCSDLIHREGALAKDFLDKSLGGAPKAKPENYLALSPYSANSPDGGNAKCLKNIAIRLYSEPDLQFVQKKYCEELQFEDINAFDLERLNKFLLKMGNNEIEYITTRGKGFHSWNIVDPTELTEWIIKVSN